MRDDGLTRNGKLASGLLHATFPAHYRTVTTLRFTPDSRILLSSSLDSAVHVYLVSRLFDRSSSFHKPYGALTDHTLPIRDVHLSHTSSVSGGRCWTASEDGTVKVWSLHPPFDLLCTFTFPPGTIPSTIAVDPTERFFCVGTEQGQVYHVAMFRRRGQIGDVNGGDLEAVGGGGIGEPGVKAGPSVFSSKQVITFDRLKLVLTRTQELDHLSESITILHSSPGRHFRRRNTRPRPSLVPAHPDNQRPCRPHHPCIDHVETARPRRISRVGEMASHGRQATSTDSGQTR